MGTITMYDAITVANIPTTALYAAGYAGGIWPTYANGDLRAHLPHATLLSIAINKTEVADCLDVEKGDASVDDVPGWVKTAKVNRPVIYGSVSSMNSIISVLAANNIHRQSVRLWAAHYGNGQHICGPGTCGQINQDMDGTQWTSNAQGKELDQSLLIDNFFTTHTTVPSTAMMPVPPTVQNGSTGQFVKRAQAVLNAIYNQELTVDGDFGPGTEASVKALQVSKGLPNDGIIGPDTWKVLYLG